MFYLSPFFQSIISITAWRNIIVCLAIKTVDALIDSPIPCMNFASNLATLTSIYIVPASFKKTCKKIVIFILCIFLFKFVWCTVLSCESEVSHFNECFGLSEYFFRHFLVLLFHFFTINCCLDA